MLVINTLETSRATMDLGGKRVTIEQASEFPRRGRSLVAVYAANGASFGVKIRLPQWAVRAEVEIAGQRIKADLAGWFCLPVRSWKDGDHISVDFRLGPRLIDGDHGNAGLAALGWGPFVLAFDQDRNPDLPAAEKLALPETQRMLMPPLGPDPFIIARVAGGGGAPPRVAAFVLFADAGRGGGPYRVWLRHATAAAGGGGYQPKIDKDGWEVLFDGKNPDGGKNDFPYAIGKLPREGFVALQNYDATPVWFRNVRIKPITNRQPRYTGKEPIERVLAK